MDRKEIITVTAAIICCRTIKETFFPLNNEYVERKMNEAIEMAIKLYDVVSQKVQVIDENQKAAEQIEEEKWRDLRTRDFFFSLSNPLATRVANACICQDVDTMGDLFDMGEINFKTKIFGLRQIGQKTLDYVRKTFEERLNVNWPR